MQLQSAVDVAAAATARYDDGGYGGDEDEGEHVMLISFIDDVHLKIMQNTVNEKYIHL